LIALRLAISGYGQGDPERIMAMRVDIVMMVIQFEAFSMEFEQAFMALNTPKENS